MFTAFKGVFTFYLVLSSFIKDWVIIGGDTILYQELYQEVYSFISLSVYYNFITTFFTTTTTINQLDFVGIWMDEQ